MCNWGHILILLSLHLNPEPVGQKKTKEKNTNGKREDRSKKAKYEDISSI